MKKRILSLIVSLAMALSLLPMAAVSVSAEPASVSYLEPVYIKGIAKNGIDKWETKACTAYESVDAGNAERVTWGTAGETSWYVVSGTVTFSKGIEIKGDVRIILKDGCNLVATSENDKAAINVSEGSQAEPNSLTIYAQSTGAGMGSLSAVTTVTGGDYNGAAGIGGNVNETCGSITINGGKVTANSLYIDKTDKPQNVGVRLGAGIGGGYCSTGSDVSDPDGCGKNITINGGEVTAISSIEVPNLVFVDMQIEGSYIGAGIGGGAVEDQYKNATIKGCGSNIIINGGTVTAKSLSDRQVTSNGAGIGGGYCGNGEDITINGGNVTAHSIASGINSVAGAGIGGGSNHSSSCLIEGKNITINGGTVDAVSKLENCVGTNKCDPEEGPGAGIGGGYGGNGTDITITGGEVNAQSICELDWNTVTYTTTSAAIDIASNLQFPTGFGGFNFSYRSRREAGGISQSDDGIKNGSLIDYNGSIKPIIDVFAGIVTENYLKKAWAGKTLIAGAGIGGGAGLRNDYGNYLSVRVGGKVYDTGTGKNIMITGGKVTAESKLGFTNAEGETNSYNYYGTGIGNGYFIGDVSGIYGALGEYSYYEFDSGYYVFPGDGLIYECSDGKTYAKFDYPYEDVYFWNCTFCINDFDDKAKIETIVKAFLLASNRNTYTYNDGGKEYKIDANNNMYVVGEPHILSASYSTTNSAITVSSNMSIKAGTSNADLLAVAAGRSDDTDITESLIPVYVQIVEPIDLSFDAQGGSQVSTETVDYSCAVKTIPTTTKNGYTFKEWNTKADGSGTKLTTSIKHTADTTYYAIWEAVNKTGFSVSGKVTQETPTIEVNVPGALVVLVKIGEKTPIASTTTDSNGDYVFTGVALGQYNIVVTGHASGTADKTKTTLVNVDNSNKSGVNVVLPQGDVSSLVEVKPNTPQVLVGGLDDEAVSQAGSNLSDKIRVVLSVESVEDITNSTTASPSAIAAQVAIKEEASGKTVEFIEMDVTKYVNTNDSAIHETSNVLEIIIPFTTEGRNDISVYRFHDADNDGILDAGQQIALTRLDARPTAPYTDGTYYVGDGFIVIYTKYFSAYAIGYTVRTPRTPGDSDYTAPKTLKFVDVFERDYFYDAVYWAVEKDVTSGTDETHFSPRVITNRAQMVTFLWRCLGRPKAKGTYNPFTDVKEGSYYYDAVIWGVENGVVKGTTKTTFSPNQEVTRGQAMAFIARYAGVTDDAEGYTHSFTDVKLTSYYSNAISWASTNGIASGKTLATFAPDEGCQRAHIVVFLYNYFKK